MKKRLQVLIIPIFAAFGLWAQTATDGKAARAAQFFLHLDKGVYAAGQTIWFKMYSYANGLPLVANEDFYFHLTTEDGKTVETRFYPQSGSTVKGSFDLPPQLSPGKYAIRVFSGCSLRENSSNPLHTSYFFVGGKTRHSGCEQKSSLRFFPESGNLIESISSLIVVRATNDCGDPVAAEGKLYSDDGTSLSVTIGKDGFGRVVLKPQSQKRYWIVLSNDTTKHYLPLAQPSGVALQVSDEQGGKQFLLTRSYRDRNQFKKMRLKAWLAGGLVYDEALDFDNYISVKGHIRTGELPSGILVFRAFGEDGKLLAGRPTFVDNGRYTQRDTNAIRYRKEGETLLIGFRDAAAKTLSVSVTDITNDATESDNILNSFLLRDPDTAIRAFGVNNSANSVDNLLLTHHLPDHEKAPQPELTTCKRDYLIRISGTVSSARENAAVKGGELRIFFDINDSTTQSYVLPVDEQGRFFIDSLYFEGEKEIHYVYSAGRNKQMPVALSIERDTLLSFVKTLSASVAAPNDTLPMAGLMEGVVVSTGQTRPRDVVNQKYATGVFRSMGRMVLDNVNEPVLNERLNVLEYILQRIQTIALEGGKLVNKKNFSLMTGQRWPVEMFYDELSIPLTSLQNLTMRDVAMIKFYETGFPGGNITQYPGGAVAVYTKKHSDYQPKQKKVSVQPAGSFRLQGYSAARRFSADSANVTLYWNPDVFSDGKLSSVQLPVAVGGEVKKIRIVVQGFSAEGQLIYLQKDMDL